jgi:hypothetical protein
MNMLEAALEYLERGFSIFPCKLDKRPALSSWLPYQEKAPTIEEIKRWWANGSAPAMALVTGKASGVVVVDIDDMEVGVDSLSKYIPLTIKTPIVKTPTGGMHLYFKDPGDFDVRNNAKAIPGCDFRGNGGYVICPPSHCEYKKGGKEIKGDYQWVSDLDTPLADLPASYISFINSFVFSNAPARSINDAIVGPESQQVTQVTESHIFDEGSRDENLFHLANLLVKAGGEIPFIKEILIRIINSWGEHDPKWAETKIKSAMERANRRERNIMGELREYIESQEGHIKVTEWSQMSQIVTKQEKHALTMAFKRLFDEGKLKRGTRAGEYEIVNDTLVPIDFMSAEDKEIPIHFPFSLEQFVKIYPKNIIVVAGEPNAGKTGFLLNVARANQKKHEIHYFSSEMGPMETRVRLDKFQGIAPAEWTTKFWERAEGFQDVIRPDAINLIDFLEITEDFWKVGRLLRDIFNKLNKGIAVIALQKNPSKKLKDGTETGVVGLGGYRGLEKPRLYLTMGDHTLKIVKAKNWRTEENPNGRFIRFRIGGGCTFKALTEWEKENDKYGGLIGRQPGDEPD